MLTMATKMELWVALHGKIHLIDYEGDDPETFVSSKYPSCEWGVFLGIEDERKKKQVFTEFDLHLEKVGGWRQCNETLTRSTDIETTLDYIKEFDLTKEEMKRLFEASEDGYLWDIEKDEINRGCDWCDKPTEDFEDLCHECDRKKKVGGWIQCQDGWVPKAEAEANK